MNETALTGLAYSCKQRFTLRMVTRPFSACLCYIAGVIGDLPMWISVETIVSLGITLGVPGLFWLLENRDFLDKCLH